MEINKTFNINKEDIKKNKFNILIPICVGNRFFLEGVNPTKNIEEYINWALENTKEKVLILILDKIQISNWIVRNSNVSQEVNMRRLIKRGKKIKENILEIRKKLSKQFQKKIEILRWEDYFDADPYCKQTTKIVYHEFEKNKKFRQEILEAVKDSIKDRVFSEKNYLILCNYVLDEFALAYHGTNFKENYYGIYIYPETDEVLELIESIKQGKTFKDLSNRLNKQKISVVLIK